jgi:hypothetical protein
MSERCDRSWALLRKPKEFYLKNSTKFRQTILAGINQVILLAFINGSYSMVGAKDRK